MSKVNLLNLDLSHVATLVGSLDAKPYRAKQIYQWLHQGLVSSIDEMTNLSIKFREQLSAVASIELPQVAHESVASDGTIKWVLTLTCSNSIETIFIPERNRGTLCVSSQAGCAANCQFCHTAVGGFNRDLSVAEIIGQVNFAMKRLQSMQPHAKITNIVMMGMGEPLLNYQNVLQATNMMMDDNAYGLSKYRVTISTIGIIPKLIELSKHSKAALTVSLHATTDALRTKIMPINRKYPLNELLDVCKTYYVSQPNRKITFAYIMLKDVNDSKDDANRLAKLIANIPCKVNLIPFNSFYGAEFESSEMEQILAFRNVLLSKGLQATIRKTRGDDVNAACGQLVGQVLKRQKKSLHN